KKLNLQAGFFEQLVAPVVESLGGVFPELKQQQDIIRRVIRSEEESFGRTIDRGLQEFQREAELLDEEWKVQKAKSGGAVPPRYLFPGTLAFKLFDTYGFPL